MSVSLEEVERYESLMVLREGTGGYPPAKET